MLPAISTCQRTSLGVVILNKVLITGDVECPPPASTCRSISLKYAIWLIYDGLLIKLKVNILWTCFLASSTQNKSLEFSTFSNLTLKSIFRIKTLLNFTKSSWSSQLHLTSLQNILWNLSLSLILARNFQENQDPAPSPLSVRNIIQIILYFFRIWRVQS